MKRILVTTTMLTVAAATVAPSHAEAQATGASEYTVTMDQAEHGSVHVSPALPANGKVAAGTVLTLTATPESGFALDALFYSVPGPYGAMYHDSPDVPTLRVTVDQDKHIGGYFIPASELVGIHETQDVVYAKPGVKTLKYDVYAPEGAHDLPCLVIIHGGGWSTNDENIMRGLARELARSGRYVVFSIDYRWIGDLDGDEPGNTMADLIGDVFGAIAHIQEHAREYGGDPTRIGVTGDSAGGHLSAAVATMTNMIGDGGFGRTPGVYQYMPSYIPRNKTVAQVRTEEMAAIQAAAPSYGVFVFDNPNFREFLHLQDADDAALRAIAPIYSIPDARERAVPHYLTRGTVDPIIQDADVKAYTDALVKAGQRAEYVQVGGASHAFFDWKPNDMTVGTFKQYGVFYAQEMTHFFDSVFYE